MSRVHQVAVVGATGFVGRALVGRLADRGHAVVAISRHPDARPSRSGVEVLALDVNDQDRVADALRGASVAFYLVHSMQQRGFRERDRALATVFGRAAAAAGVERIVYLGGLGDAPESEHLASRQEVGPLLAAAGVHVVELRAAIVIGAGSISFEMLRYLTERLPFMVCPRWVRTRIEPIGERDLLDYLEHAMTVEPGVYELGGGDVTTYRDMIQTYARVRGLRRRSIVDVPALTPRLSSYWVDAVTPVDRSVSHALVESLVAEVVVRDPDRTRAAFPGVAPVGVEDAIREALDRQAELVPDDLFEREPGVRDGVSCARVALAVDPVLEPAISADLALVGGDYRWYGAVRGWRLRVAAGRLLGEHLALERAAGPLALGTAVDWWVVARSEPGELVLRDRSWVPGEAWLGYRVGAGHLLTVGAMRTRGVVGLLYWMALGPVHRRVFAAMARQRVERASGQASYRRRRMRADAR
ncbi:MAG TPA: DUF2867 domain-containing protein [Acidimicrobiia bacterium]|jgi:uncharacterized protein YbjT (DUF2867 family)